MGEEEVDKLHLFVAKVGDEIRVSSFYLRLNLTASPWQGHFLITHLHLGSRTDILLFSF